MMGVLKKKNQPVVIDAEFEDGEDLDDEDEDHRAVLARVKRLVKDIKGTKYTAVAFVLAGPTDVEYGTLAFTDRERLQLVGLLGCVQRELLEDL